MLLLSGILIPLTLTTLAASNFNFISTVLWNCQNTMLTFLLFYSCLLPSGSSASPLLPKVGKFPQQKSVLYIRVPSMSVPFWNVGFTNPSCNVIFTVFNRLWGVCMCAHVCVCVVWIFRCSQGGMILYHSLKQNNFHLHVLDMSAFHMTVHIFTILISFKYACTF